MDKYLVINKYSYIDADFLETDDKSSPFVIKNYIERGENESCPPCSLYFQYDVFNNKIKEICKTKHVSIYKEDKSSVDNAKGVRVKKAGMVQYRRGEGVWDEILPVEVELIPFKDEKNKSKESLSTSSKAKDKKIAERVTRNSDKKDEINLLRSEGKRIDTNVVEWTIEDKKETENEETASIVPQEKVHQQDKIETNKKEKTDTFVPPITEGTSSIYNNIQYLMSGREEESYFYEGSTSDASGASFKIEYESSSMKGLYSLIVDMNNLRTINPGFRREVIKIENNGTTIREASAFTIVNKGEAHFSKEDSVWIVDKPLVIKLLK